MFSRMLVLGLACCLGQSLAAGLSISSYMTAAGTNAFAPLSRDQFFEEQTLEATSPASAHANGDWTGTNFGGSIQTWHWIGSSRIDTSTALNVDALTIGATASFSRELSTTSDFVSPNLSATMYSPLSSAGYTCFFLLNVPANYELTGTLLRDSQFQLYSITQGSLLADKFNLGTVPMAVDLSGILIPGQYQLVASSGAAGLSFSRGAHHELISGGFSNFLFTVQVPEPIAGLQFALLAPVVWRRRRLGI